MSIDPKRAQAVFLEAVDHADRAERALILDRECSGDADLRRRVELLLQAHEQPFSLIDRPIVEPLDTNQAPLAERKNGDSSIKDADIFATGVSGPPFIDQSDVTVAAGLQAQAVGRALPAISGYEILGELGRGGMGVVYRARQVRLNRPCVLKMILAGAHAGSEAVARFLAEAEAVARLQHPNIVQIYDIGEADGLPFFALEYVDGGSLDQRLDGTPWPPRQAAELIETVAGALPRPTAEASSTATSSRATSCWRRTARPRSPTSAWPSRSTRTAA